MRGLRIEPHLYHKLGMMSSCCAAVWPIPKRNGPYQPSLIVAWILAPNPDPYQSEHIASAIFPRSSSLISWCSFCNHFSSQRSKARKSSMCLQIISAPKQVEESEIVVGVRVGRDEGGIGANFHSLRYHGLIGLGWPPIIRVVDATDCDSVVGDGKRPQSANIGYKSAWAGSYAFSQK